MERHSHHGHWVHALFWVAIAVAIFGGATMLLWNALIPSLFALPTLTFPQACGLVVLTRLLFGSHAHALMFLTWEHRGHHGHRRDRFHQRWNQMTPDERRCFRDRFHQSDMETDSETKTAGENQVS